ncbi:hypothetical protein [uncultured Sphingomonas sp.]|uniref:hypothetical protein n=1 Tax=uncultured Sphingomonas sp. TaxID=158754 RepID=UPI0025F59B00|nr:hypothetical protein [uncultured Sphingomonas sp.]
MLDRENEATPADCTAGATPEVTLKPDLDAAPTLQNLADTDVQRLLTYLGGPVQFASMVPDGGPMRFAIFEAGDPAADAFVARNDREARSSYYSLNRVRPGLSSKATKADIVEAIGAHADIDPRKAGGPFDKPAVIARLRSLDVPPSFIVDSGGGLQPIWLFDAPTGDFDLVEGVNRSLVALFDADPGTFNIDRLLRVPGSLNTPNAKKAAAGRVPVMARFL